MIFKYLKITILINIYYYKLKFVNNVINKYKIQ